MTTIQYSNPQAIAEAGNRIYSEQLRAELEGARPGEFVVIDVTTGKYFVDQFPERALEAGRAASPNGLFHLIRIGSPGAFRVSYYSHADSHGFFR